jgi:type 1 glutamine amidotransferase
VPDFITRRSNVAGAVIAALVLSSGCKSEEEKPADLDAGVDAGLPPAVLVFSRTRGFRHASIADGIVAIKALGQANQFVVDATEDPTVFGDAELAAYRAVIFLSTTGDVLDTAQEAAFERFINAGGGFVGIHSATDTEYDWPFYGTVVGAYFSSHPAIQDATLRVEDASHPATAHLAPSWERRDEWYNFATNPRAQVRVLIRLDEGTYQGGTMGADHPWAWCHVVNGGRAFYTAGGHTAESFQDEAFRLHLLGGIRYAAGLTGANCAP